MKKILGFVENPHTMTCLFCGNELEVCLRRSSEAAEEDFCENTWDAVVTDNIDFVRNLYRFHTKRNIPIVFMHPSPSRGSIARTAGAQAYCVPTPNALCSALHAVGVRVH